MKTRLIILAMLLLLTFWDMPIGRATVKRIGIPRLDEIVAEVELDPEIATARFLAGDFDFMPDVSRAEDRDALNASGHTLVEAPGFHVCYAAFNTRDYVPDYAPKPDAGKSLYPLNLTSFRLALAWSSLSVVQKEIAINNIYSDPGAFVPAYTIVPEALGVWHNPNVTIPSGNYTLAWQTLEAAGFDNTTTPGTLLAPNGHPVRDIELLSPVESPNDVEFCQRFVDQWNNFFDNYVGVKNCNFVNRPVPLCSIVTRAFVYRNFDMYWLCWGLSRFPDFLYDFFHSSRNIRWGYNSPGINDTELDGYIETIKWGLDFNAKYQAAWDAQERLYELTPYIYFYHRNYWEGIRGTVPEPLVNYVPMCGYGTDNAWTWNLMHWARARPHSRVNYVGGTCWDDLHPGKADSPFETWVIDRISHSLTATTPDLREIPWIALDCWLQPFQFAPLEIDGMQIIFRLRNDLYWNDGFPITVEDIEFSWEFMRNFYPSVSTYRYLLWVEIHDPQTITAYLNTTSTSIFYDFAELALRFPKHIYDPAAHPTRDTVNDPVWQIDWDDWMADYTGTIPETAGYPYTALVNCGPYDFVEYDSTSGACKLLRHNSPGDFFHDSPIEGAVNIPGRIGHIPHGSCPFDGSCQYNVTIVNAGSTDSVTGEFTECIIDRYEVYIDGMLDTVESIGYSLHPFHHVEFGPHATSLDPCVHNITVLVYEEGIPEPIDVSTQFIIATPREDLNYDIFVGIDDIVRAGEAFGASPPPLSGNERWNSRADLNDDYYVGIDDLVDIAEDFGSAL